jgi:hypothetical protein
LNDDFKLALYTQLGLTNGVSAYSIDDLWKRYIISTVSADGNAEAGNPAAAGRGMLGHVGQAIGQYYSEDYRRNPGNANAFPVGSQYGNNPSENFTHSGQGWALAPGTYQCDNVFTGETARAQCFYISNDGTNLMWGSSTMGGVKSMSLSTPWDLSTATQTGTTQSMTNPWPSARFINDGAYYTVVRATDTFEIWPCANPYEINQTDVSGGTVTKADTTLTASTDGPYFCLDAGTVVYYLGSQTGTNLRHISRIPLGTPYDFDTVGTVAIQNVHTPITSFNTNANLHVTEDEKWLYAINVNNQNVLMFEMTTPGDVTTLTLRDTWDFNPDIAYGPSGGFFSDNGNQFWVFRNTSGTPQMDRWDF